MTPLPHLKAADQKTGTAEEARHPRTDRRSTSALGGMNGPPVTVTSSLQHPDLPCSTTDDNHEHHSRSPFSCWSDLGIAIRCTPVWHKISSGWDLLLAYTSTWWKILPEATPPLTIDYVKPH